MKILKGRLSTQAFRDRFARDLRGQVSVIFGLSAVAITGTMGGSMDSAAIHRSAVQLQDAADAAALHAVRAANSRNLTDAQIGEAARVALESAYESSDAAQPGDNSVETTVLSHAPTKVEVTASRVVDLPFGFLHPAGTVTITRRSTAVEATRTPVTLLLLDRTASSAWRATGSSSVIAQDGAAIVNSSSAQALNGVGAADIVTAATMVAGPAQDADNWTPKPSFGAKPLDDPYASTLTWPATGACKETNLAIKKKTVTLQPGTYCGGIDLQTHADVTLAPGVYVLTGPLQVTSHARLNAPSDVTIVLKSDTSFVRFQSGSEVVLKAPTSGPWSNIAIAQYPQSSEITSTLIGGAELDMDGVLYFPTQKLLVTGGASTTLATGSRIVIANRLETQGNGAIYLRGDSDILAVNTGVRLVK